MGFYLNKNLSEHKTMNGEKNAEEEETFYDCESTVPSSLDDNAVVVNCESNAESSTSLQTECDKQTYEDERNLKETSEFLENLEVTEAEAIEEILSEAEKEDRRSQAIDLKNQGNEEYKQKNYVRAEDLYTEGLRVCPKSCTKERSVLYGNRCACLMSLNKKEDAILDCEKALELNPNYMKVIIRHAQLLEDTEKFAESLKAYKKILDNDPSHYQARSSCIRLEKKIEVQNEKMKEEMMGQLKNIGNMFLKPFGLSTNNFQMKDNPDGSKNIQFVQN